MGKKEKRVSTETQNQGMFAYKPLFPTTEPPKPADQIAPLISLYSDSLWI